MRLTRRTGVAAALAGFLSVTAPAALSQKLEAQPKCTVVGAGGYQIRKLTDFDDVDEIRLVGPNRLAVSDKSGIRLWSPDSQQVIQQLYGADESGWIEAVSPDGQTIAWTMLNSADLRRADTGQIIARLDSSSFQSLVFSPDGSRLAGETIDDMIRLFDGHTGVQVSASKLANHESANLRFSEDSKRLIVSASDGVGMIDAATGAALYPNLARRDDVVFNAQGTRALIGGEAFEDQNRPAFAPGDGWTLIDPETGRTLAHGGKTETAAFLWKHPFIRVETATDGWLADARTGRTVVRIRITDKSLYNPNFSLQFSADESRMISQSPDGEMRLWNLKTGRMLADLGAFDSGSRVDDAVGDRIFFDAGPVPAQTFSFIAGGRLLVAEDSDGALLVWDARTGQRRRSWDGKNFKAWPSPDDKTALVASSDGDKLALWNLETGGRLGSLRGHVESSDDFSFSPSGDLLVVSGASDMAVWDVRRRARLWTLPGHVSGGDIQFLNNEHYLLRVNRDDGALDDVFDARTGRRLAETWADPVFVTLGSSHLMLSWDSLWDLDRAERVLDCRPSDRGPFEGANVEHVASSGALIKAGYLTQYLWRLERLP